MSIPPELAHLYSLDGTEDGGTGTGELEEGLPRREVSLEALTLAEAKGEEDLSAGDVDELAVLLLAKPELRADAEVVELGLGSIVDGELELNSNGRRVLARALERMKDGLR